MLLFQIRKPTTYSHQVWQQKFYVSLENYGVTIDTKGDDAYDANNFRVITQERGAFSVFGILCEKGNSLIHATKDAVAISTLPHIIFQGNISIFQY